MTPTSPRSRSRAFVLAGLLWLARPAQAADTTETWGLGATDAEFTVGLDGLTSGRGQGSVVGDVLLGYGVARHLSLYLGTSLEATDTLRDGAASLRTGVFGTPVDTEHVDVDLFLELGLAGLRQMQVRPAVEVNLDHRNDHSTLGAYLRLGLPLYGLDAAPSGTAATPVVETGLHAELTLGAYLTVVQGHQLLLELGALAHPWTEVDGPALQGPTIVLGYNAGLTDNLELLTQLSTGAPDASGAWPLGISAGFIATLPGGA